MELVDSFSQNVLPEMQVNMTASFDPFLYRMLRELHGITSDSEVVYTAAESANSQTN